MVKLPPPIWALVYVLIATAASYFLGWPLVPDLPLVWLGVLLILAGGASAISAITLFRRAGTEITPTSPTNSKLVTSGPYAITRNPMYLGLTLAALGIAFWVGAWPMFLAPIAMFATANWAHIPFEEEKMRRQFGEAYDAYTRKVRRWL